MADRARKGATFFGVRSRDGALECDGVASYYAPLSLKAASSRRTPKERIRAHI